MSDLMARLSAITYAVLLVIAVGVLWVTSQPNLTAHSQIKAEFKDVYPLLTGMNVREWGAPAGTVSDIELTDHGTVLVTMQLNDGTTPPSSDATAAIREQDITGDSYVDLAPGHASQPLGDEVIPTQHTLTAPRFDDLLNSFDKPVQQSLQILLDQLGVAASGRGEDLNRAELSLRPALSAADRALREVNSQNATLRSLIGDTEKVTSQAAAGSHDLGGLVDALAKTTETTASHSASLDQALQLAPATTKQATTTLAKLRALTQASLPFARALGKAAPALATTATLLGPFLDNGVAVIGDVVPTLSLTRGLFNASEPTLESDPKHFFTAPFDIATGSGKLLTSLLGQKDVVKSLFGANGYGQPPKNHNDVGLAAAAVEHGNQSGYPANYDPQRNFLRAVAVPTCETLGFRIVPGCLLDAISKTSSRTPASQGATHSGGGNGAGSGGGGGGGAANQPPAGGGGGGPPGNLGDQLNQILHDLPGDLLPHGSSGGQPQTPQDLRDLLDFVLGP